MIRRGNILSARNRFSLYDFRKVTDANFTDRQVGLRLKPIPVTYEVLLNVGIKKSSSHSRFFTMGDLRLKFKKNELLIFKDEKLIGSCFFLHELQNFYYDQKGEDYNLSI